MISTRLRVKELLRQRRWTTKVLAEKTGMSESYLTHIKNGTRRWNEDALKKLAMAFELEPTDIFDCDNQKRTDAIKTAVQLPQDQENKDFTVNVVPVVGQIPSQPSAYNNQVVQQATGCQDEFVPVLGANDDSVFCLKLQDNALAPNFVKGDLLVVAPDTWTNSGDIVAVEYGADADKKQIIAQVNFMDEFVVLESINHKQAPIALVRGKDQFRIIGKVIHRYQTL